MSKPSPNKKQSTSDNKLEALWTSITCGELTRRYMAERKRSMITISHKVGVAEACEILAKNAISSAPIVDREQGVVVGLFDFRDLGACLTRVIDNLSREELEKGNVRLSTVLSHETAELAADLSEHNHFHSVQEEDPLVQAVEFFGNGQHRVLVLNKDKDIVGILSQSDALAYLKEHIKASGMADMTLEELKVIRPKEQVIAVKEDRSVLDALKLMQSSRVSSLALVDKAGNLSGNFSMTDVKYLLQIGRLDTIMHSVQDFVRKVRLVKDMEMHGKTQALVFTALPSTTLQSMVGKLSATRSHRVWIVEMHPSGERQAAWAGERSCAGLVTLSDILRVLTPKKSQSLWKSHPLMEFVPAV